MAKKIPSESKPAGARANRRVTCPTCGVQMPQRYLAGHSKQHAPPPDSANTSPEPGSEGSAPSVPAIAAAGLDHPSSLVCPACAAFVPEAALALHMQDRHSGWCPLCRISSANLAAHLQSSHHVRPIQPAPPYERDWESQARFTCMWCKKEISVWAYPRHEQPHHLRTKDEMHKE